jgi:Pyrimidine reductase, riboflavin biosynthesis
VVLTKSGNLPLEHPFWGRDRQIIYSQTPLAEIYQQRAIVRQFSGDLLTVLADLYTAFRVNTLLIEAGSSLNYQFIANGWADEFFLTISPVFVGGKDNLNILGGDRYGLGESQLARAELVSVHHLENEVYLRYRFVR